jgi:uncharacterized protein
MSATTGNPVIHFEIGCMDLEKTTAFYSNLFGWSPTSIPMGSLLQTNSPKGIQGHLTSLGHEPHQYVTFYIEVDVVSEHLEKIVAAGGQKLLGPVPLPDGRQFAWFKDPEGNMVGLLSKAAV